ncbi:MAG: EAL domain-containing protein [Eubacterium sp.]|nr:EAL domain-containing protein [Eubacterium sp.]
MLPSLLILAIIQCFYYAWPRLPVRMNRAFQAVVLSDCLVVLCDLLASNADTDYTSYSTAALYCLNMAYFVIYLARVYCFFEFNASILHIPYKKNFGGVILNASVFIISELITLSSFFTGAVFSIQADGYQKGPLYNVLYVCFVFYILHSIVLLVQHRDQLIKNQFVSALAAQLILLTGNVARFLFPNVLIMNMFCLMAIFVLFLGFQNPRIYRASEGNAFNLTGLREMIDEKRNDDDFCIFAFTVKNYFETRSFYGGVQMDKCIALICQYMAETFPKQCVFYLGNGAFAVTGISEAAVPELHKKLMAHFREPWIVDTADIYIRAGYVYLKPDERFDTTDKIIDYLHGALREASSSKRRDEDILESDFFDKLETLTGVKRALEEAITTESVDVYLMPVVDASTRKLKYAEALSRITGRNGKIIPPDLFIPVAERNGQINDIGLQVLDKVCAFISENHPQDWGMDWINVNVSPVQFMNRNLCSQFLEILKKHDVDPEQIHLEITEQATSDIEELKQQIDMLIKAGFRLSLDDYGKGYSNISRLNELPFADIKIDMEVVWDYCRKKDILLPSLISTLKKLGFTITSEGIENEEIASMMREAGSDYLQGYLFSKPVPMKDCIPHRN